MYAAWNLNEGVNDPIKYIYTLSGYTAYIFLSISLIAPRGRAGAYKKYFGITAFLYASIHFLNFFILDMEGDVAYALGETVKKPFIYLGSGGFLILLFMTLTSFRIFFVRFYKWHILVYLAYACIITHFYLSQKVLDMYDIVLIGFSVGILLLKLFYLKTRKRYTE